MVSWVSWVRFASHDDEMFKLTTLAHYLISSSCEAKRTYETQLRTVYPLRARRTGARQAHHDPYRPDPCLSSVWASYPLRLRLVQECKADYKQAKKLSKLLDKIEGVMGELASFV